MKNDYNFDLLRRARLSRGLTKKTVAQHTGLDAATITRVEAGNTQSPPTILRLSEFLKVDMADLVSD